jgi:hypothetical protein
VAVYQFHDPTDYITQTQGYSLFASAQFGSNSGSTSASELSLGTSSTWASGQTTWDGNLANGFDTDELFVQLEVDFDSGHSTFSVFNSSEPVVSFNGPTGGTVGSLVIRSGAQVATGFSSWAGFDISFFRDGTEQEAISISGDTTAQVSSSGGQSEQLLTVTPGASNYDKVVVSCWFRMMAGQGVTPGWTGLFGQILVMPGT